MARTNLDDIQVFMAVADAGSFAGGGQAVKLTRSAAGKAVARLEERLGTRLVHRTTRAFSLTDEGRVLQEQGRLVLSALEGAEAAVAGTGGTPRGTLRLTVPDAFGRLVLMPVLTRYMTRYPAVTVEIAFGDRPADIVEEGFDVAVRMDPSTGSALLVSRTVARFDAALFAAPDYLDRRGTPRSLDDLAEHDALVLHNRGVDLAWRLQDGQGNWATARGRPRLRADNAEALCESALAGMGIAYLPDFLVRRALADDRLRAVLPDRVRRGVEVIVLYPGKRRLEPRARLFIDMLAEELGRPNK